MKTKYILLIGIMTLFNACKKDFLDKTVYGVMSVDEFYKTDDDVQEAVMSCYDVLQWAYAADWGSMYLVKTLPSDETYVGGSGESDQPQYQQLDDFSFTSENPAIRQVFLAMYYGVSRANAIINRVNADTDYKKEMVAEAKALRAYFYFELTSMFGKVPLTLSLASSSDEYNKPAASINDIYSQIYKDLIEAIPTLKLRSEYDSNMKFRISKGTAQAILGKAYLYNNKYEKSAQIFEDIIASEEYSLQSDYSTLFLKESEYGVESVFEISYETNEAYDWGSFRWNGNRQMESNIHLQLTGPRSDYFKGGSSGLVGGWGFNYPTKSIAQVFEESGDVVRRNASLISVANLKSEYGGDWTAEGDVWGMDGFFRVKYAAISGETNNEEGAVPMLNYGTNQRLIRYADVLLMAAEADLQGGGTGKAQAYLDMVRTRAGLSSVSANMENIKIERQLELAFEGVRYLDLIRWGDAPDKLVNQGFRKNGKFVEGKHELYPIPLDEVNNNAEMKQNPNW